MNITKLQSLSGLSFSTEQKVSFINKLTDITEFLKKLDQYDVSDTESPILIYHTHDGSNHTNVPEHIDLLCSVKHQLEHRHIIVQSAVKKS